MRVAPCIAEELKALKYEGRSQGAKQMKLGT